MDTPKLGVTVMVVFCLLCVTGCRVSAEKSVGQSAFTDTQQTKTNTLSRICYIGPLEVRVTRRDQTMVGGLGVAVFDKWWIVPAFYSPYPSKAGYSTDKNGILRLDRVEECISPTLVYAWDPKAKRAGFAVVRELSKLAEPVTVELKPARLVTGRIEVRGIQVKGLADDFCVVHVAPFPEPPGRSLRYAIAAGLQKEFAFLLPEEETFFLTVATADGGCMHGIKIFVPKGEGVLSLGILEVGKE